MPQNELIQALDKMKQDFFEKDWGTYEIEHEGVENQIHGWPGRADLSDLAAFPDLLDRLDFFCRLVSFSGLPFFPADPSCPDAEGLSGDGVSSP